MAYKPFLLLIATIATAYAAVDADLLKQVPVKEASLRDIQLPSHKKYGQATWKHPQNKENCTMSLFSPPALLKVSPSPCGSTEGQAAPLS